MNFSFKTIVIFMVFLYAVITVLFFNLYKHVAIKETKSKASYILSNIKEMRLYAKEHLRPTLYEQLVKNKDINNIDPLLLSTNLMVNTILKENLKNSEFPYEYKLASSNPLNPDNLATAFENEILEIFKKDENKNEYIDIIKENGTSYFFMAMPIERNAQSCLLCHGKPENAPKKLIEQYGNKSGYNYKVGNLEAIAYVKIALVDIVKGHSTEFFWGGLAMFLAFIVIIFLIYLVFKKDKKLQLEREGFFYHQNRLVLMGSMIGNISHQLKQPLTFLSNIFINIELQIEKNNLDFKRLKNKVENANEQIKFMSDTIDDFKNFFLPKDTQNNSCINDIIAKTKNLLMDALVKNNIEIEVNVENNFTVFAPKNEIVQVFINIINNAKDAFLLNNIENRQIKINAITKNNKNYISIQNNGGNINKENISSIFDPYFTTKDLSNATGIGLFMSKNIIENHKGSIDVKNCKDGVIFTIVFTHS